jgi:hypothetical protein
MHCGYTATRWGASVHDQLVLVWCSPIHPPSDPPFNLTEPTHQIPSPKGRLAAAALTMLHQWPDPWLYPVLLAPHIAWCPAPHLSGVRSSVSSLGPS